jgi:hypothetical protein
LWVGAGQDVSESDGAGAQHTAERGTGAGPKTELSGSDWAGAGPAKPGHLECDSDMLGLPSGRRLLARTRWDSVPSVLPNGPCSDGFLMNSLEEGA